jgi:hypothetical protein
MGKMKTEDLLSDRRTVSNDARHLFEEKKVDLGKILLKRIKSNKTIAVTTDLWTDDIKHQGIIRV